MTAPLKISIYAAGLVALFAASFITAQLAFPNGAGDSWFGPAGQTVEQPAEHGTTTHSLQLAPAASGSNS